MKSYITSHLIGFLLFNFVVVSFVLAFAFFYAPPIPRVEEVKQPAYSYDYRYNCRRKKPKKPREVSSEVLSSRFLLKENKVVSQIKLKWNGEGVKPENLTVTSSFFSPDNFDTKAFGDVQKVAEPFRFSNEKVIFIESKVTDERLKKQNLYVVVKAFTGNSELEFDEAENLSKATQVLSVYTMDTKIGTGE